MLIIHPCLSDCGILSQAMVVVLDTRGRLCYMFFLWSKADCRARNSNGCSGKTFAHVDVLDEQDAVRRTRVVDDKGELAHPTIPVRVFQQQVIPEIRRRRGKSPFILRSEDISIQPKIRMKVGEQLDTADRERP
jgi:hypothetical protein